MGRRPGTRSAGISTWPRSATVALPSVGEDTGKLGGLADAVAAVAAVLDRLSGPFVLVGHSYSSPPVTQIAAAREDVTHVVYASGRGGRRNRQAPPPLGPRSPRATARGRIRRETRDVRSLRTGRGPVCRHGKSAATPPASPALVPVRNVSQGPTSVIVVVGPVAIA